MSGDRPVVFEVEMLNAVGKPGRYRVLRNPPGRLTFESFGRGVTLPEVSSEGGERWIETHSLRTVATLVCLGGQSGCLSIDNLEAIKHEGDADMDRVASALFVSPLLAPCGGCGDWNPLAAEVCADCELDPRVIVVPCERCLGVGEVMAEEGNLLRDCPSCDATKVEETSTGTARWKYLKRAVAAGILTEDQAGAAIIEE